MHLLAYATSPICAVSIQSKPNCALSCKNFPYRAMANARGEIKSCQVANLQNGTGQKFVSKMARWQIFFSKTRRWQIFSPKRGGGRFFLQNGAVADFFSKMARWQIFSPKRGGGRFFSPKRGGGRFFLQNGAVADFFSKMARWQIFAPKWRGGRFDIFYGPIITPLIDSYDRLPGIARNDAEFHVTRPDNARVYNFSVLENVKRRYKYVL